jgi:hypothetical protein
MVGASSDTVAVLMIGVVMRAASKRKPSRVFGRLVYHAPL